MLTTYYAQDGLLRPATESDLRQALWIDLLEPSREEEGRVEGALGISIPTREEMREVESSSAIYREQGVSYVTIRLVHRRESAPQPELSSVTLILTESQFVTIRYANPRSFQQFIDRTQHEGNTFPSAMAAMLCLLETVVDRDADILEEVGDRLEPISLEVFSQNTGAMERIAAADLSRVLQNIGQSGELASRVRQSLHSVGRSVPFLQLQWRTDAAMSTRLKTLGRDVQSLLDHDNFLQIQIQFLLDSCVGLISIQQNAIMKTLSIAAAIFLPPTLIGSIYGMNFDHIPAQHWHFGFFFAISLMITSAVLPLVFFRSRRWL